MDIELEVRTSDPTALVKSLEAYGFDTVTITHVFAHLAVEEGEWHLLSPRVWRLLTPPHQVVQMRFEYEGLTSSNI